MLDMVSSCVVLYYIMLCIKNIVDGGNHFVLFYVVLCYPKNVVHGIKCCIIKACVCVCVCVRAPRARARFSAAFNPLLLHHRRPVCHPPPPGMLYHRMSGYVGPRSNARAHTHSRAGAGGLTRSCWLVVLLPIRTK